MSSSLFLSVDIPDAAFIQAARRKRELARAQDDYISLDVKHTSTTSRVKKNSDEDPESEPDDCENRIPFTPKPQTLRQRMAEETSTYLIHLQCIKAFFVRMWYYVKISIKTYYSVSYSKACWSWFLFNTNLVNDMASKRHICIKMLSKGMCSVYCYWATTSSFLTG